MFNKRLIYFFQNALRRKCCTATCPAPELTSTKLPNGTIVAAFDNYAATKRLTVGFYAGSRYEVEKGMSHMVRSVAGLSTGKSNTFTVMRQLKQVAVKFKASGNREFIFYTMEMTHESMPIALQFIVNILSCQEVRPWELEDNIPRLKYDLASVTPQMWAMDFAHQAAFRRSLGNSLYMNSNRIGTFSSESVLSYMTSTLSPSRCGISVVGDSIDKATIVANCVKLKACGNMETQPSVYYGGDVRKDTGGESANVVLALPGYSLSAPLAVALSLAASIMDCYTFSKWGKDCSLIAATAGAKLPFYGTGFHCMYSDAGLFGATFTVHKDEACEVTCNIAKFIRNLPINPNVVAAAKCNLKRQVFVEHDLNMASSEHLCSQILYTGFAKSLQMIMGEIDRIDEQMIQQALCGVIGNKFSVGATGNTVNVPFSAQLG